MIVPFFCPLGERGWGMRKQRDIHALLGSLGGWEERTRNGKRGGPPLSGQLLRPWTSSQKCPAAFRGTGCSGGGCFQERRLELALLLNILESCWDSWELGWETLCAPLCPSPWCGRGQAQTQCSSVAGLAPHSGAGPCAPARREPHRHGLSPNLDFRCSLTHHPIRRGPDSTEKLEGTP